jgi:hypothetical protein
MLFLTINQLKILKPTHLSAKCEALNVLKKNYIPNSLFLIVLILNALSTLYPKTMLQFHTLYLVFPLLFLVYLLQAKKRKSLYMVALLLAGIGEISFNKTLKNCNTIGLCFQALSLLTYAFIIYKSFQIINLRHVARFVIPMLLFVWLPTWIFSKDMLRIGILSETIFYAIAIAFFSFMVLVNFFKHKEKNSLLLLYAISALLFAAYLEGYNLFLESGKLVILLGNSLFYLAHYLICLFFICYVGRPKKIWN